jgi:hypothetical protein
MRFRILASLAAFTSLIMAPLPGQTSRAAAKTKTWTMPRTPDGHPDFQGIWTNATLTPLERGIVVAITGERVGAPPITTLNISDQDAAAYEKKIKDVGSFDRRDGGADSDVSRAYNNLFIDRGNELARVDGSKRTSLIIDPPDGKIPPLTPEARARAAARPVNRFDSVEDRPLGERCLTGFGSTVGPPMLPVGYNNNYQIVQTRGYVMILAEMIHEVRIIHMDGRSHLASSVRQWLGDSVGHWEGDTLVVETTNFTGKTRFRGSGESLRVIEHFTRVDAGTILYRFTIDDPSTFTKPWTAEYPFRATVGPIFEYACHEGNYAEADILGGARKSDAAAKVK